MAEKERDHNQILCEGKNCWRIEPAERVAFLIDGQAYFAAFKAAVERAQRSVLIVGWDFDSRIRLLHDEDPEDSAEQLPAAEGERRAASANLGFPAAASVFTKASPRQVAANGISASLQQVSGVREKTHKGYTRILNSST